MTDASTGSPDVQGYHAHVYYDADTLPVAERLKDRLAATFSVEIGRFSGAAVGPHPVPQFQIIFKEPEFQSVVPWLMLNREGLNILVHPLTDDNVADHTRFALWLGTPLPLRVEVLRRGPPAS